MGGGGDPALWRVKDLQYHLAFGAAIENLSGIELADGN
jgi:hypothetical protein